MDLFSEVSAWLQLGLMLGTLLFAWLIVRLFGRLSAWRMTWLMFAVGFAGMLASRVLLMLLVYEIEPRWLRWMHRYVSPLQAGIGLCGGMGLLYRLLRRIHSNDVIHLPHPAGFVVDAQSMVLAWDAGAQELFGWTAEEAMGQTITSLITPERRQGLHVPFIERYLKTEPASHPTVTYSLYTRWRETPREFHVEILVTAVPQADGSLQFQCVARELTAAR